MRPVVALIGRQMDRTAAIAHSAERQKHALNLAWRKLWDVAYHKFHLTAFVVHIARKQIKLEAVTQNSALLGDFVNVPDAQSYTVIFSAAQTV